MALPLAGGRRAEVPTAEPVPAEVLRKIRQVEIKARILADELLLGSYRSVFRGWGLDFEEVREYEPGDDIRSIDWNVTARMGTPYIKKFREERELTVFLLVDVSSSSWFGTAATTKRELAIDVAALLAFAAIRNGDSLSLLLFADRIKRFVPARTGQDHLLRVIRDLLFEVPVRSRTDIAAAARFISNSTKKRSVVFVISDFLDSGYEAALQRLARRHDVVACAITDPREGELPAVGVIGLEDAETGEVAYVDTSRPATRAAYAAEAQRRRQERLRTFGRIGLDRVELSTDRPYVPALMAFFRARTRRR
ncbi:MAG TPA: DUF58 domain-containing protein [Candidatus Limnocylindria bacterium]|nr:DUF58 domain-containing protein [Candidatus Limnocylindria bacterium]